MSNLLVPGPLIEPINVTIQEIVKTQTPFSTGVSGRREITNHISYEQFVLPMQVVFKNESQISQKHLLGVDEKAVGYGIARVIDLKNLNKTIKRGQKIIKMGDRVLEQALYFTHSTNDLSAHFSSVGFMYIVAVFTDRDPVG